MNLSRARATRRAVMLGLAVMIAGGCSRPDARSAAPDSAKDSTTGTASVADTRRTILFAGTSLTAGYGLDPDSAYPQLIQQKIDSAQLPFDVNNAGVSGETTAGLLQRLDWVLRGKFDVMVIETGANDGLRGVPVAAVEKNLREIVRRAKAANPEAQVVLIQMEALPNYGRTYATGFHDLYVRIAKEAGAPLLPFLLDGVAGRAELNQPDGVHPNVKGERIVAENVWRGLEPVLRARLK